MPRPPVVDKAGQLISWFRGVLVGGNQARKVLMVLSVLLRELARVQKSLEEEWIRQFPEDGGGSATTSDTVEPQSVPKE